MKKTKLISALSALCISLAVLAIGVFAATTVSYNVNSTVSFIADGVYLHAVGNVQKGPLNGEITEDTSQTTYSYEDTNYTTKQDSLEPDGSTSAGSLDAWNVGVVSFDSLNNVIEFKVVFIVGLEEKYFPYISLNFAKSPISAKKQVVFTTFV